MCPSPKKKKDTFIESLGQWHCPEEGHRKVSGNHRKRPSTKADMKSAMSSLKIHGKQTSLKPEHAAPCKHGWELVSRIHKVSELGFCFWGSLFKYMMWTTFMFKIKRRGGTSFFKFVCNCVSWFPRFGWNPEWEGIGRGSQRAEESV
jgi:hypothetical protein